MFNTEVHLWSHVNLTLLKSIISETRSYTTACGESLSIQFQKDL